MEKETRQFQAETKQLLDLMIHSIYTHKEIFLRELISNASDATDKIKFMSLTDTDLLEGNSDFHIFIKPNMEKRTLTITDNGIGMTHEDVINNIGTIARSGSRIFAQKLKESKEKSSSEVELIGQFGVGFYSAFMIGKKVTVITKAPHERAVRWESTGDGTYTLEYTDEKTTRGTEVIIELRDDDLSTEEKDHNFSTYLEEYTLENLVHKYSDYVRYPVKMEFITEETPKDAEGNEIKDAPKQIKTEIRTVNSMTPIWKKDKKEITKEEYNEFYKSKFHDWVDPAEVVHFKAEGSTVEYTALLFIPEKAPFDFYSPDFNKGLQLYSKNVFIMENCEDLLPDHFKFVKGLIDSPDFSLNISREILQHSKQLKLIGKNIEKKIIATLKDMLKNNRTKYEEFFKEFGEAIKSGIYSGQGSKEDLQELLIFKSSFNGEHTTIEEYVGRMKEKQDFIYYAEGQDKSFIDKLPQMELLKDKGYEVMYFVDRIDEFAIERLTEYKGKKFQSITRGELNLGDDTEEDKKKKEEVEKENKPLLDKIKEILKDKVSDVRITNRLKSSAVCLVSDKNGITFGMEKIMQSMPKMAGMKASRILEINPTHPLFGALKKVSDSANEDDMKKYSELLYSQAILMEGFQLEDPVEFANSISDLMIKASK